jgi:hypothetical protein
MQPTLSRKRIGLMVAAGLMTGGLTGMAHAGGVELVNDGRNIDVRGEIPDVTQKQRNATPTADGAPFHDSLAVEVSAPSEVRKSMKITAEQHSTIHYPSSNRFVIEADLQSKVDVDWEPTNPPQYQHFTQGLSQFSMTLHSDKPIKYHVKGEAAAQGVADSLVGLTAFGEGSPRGRGIRVDASGIAPAGEHTITSYAGSTDFPSPALPQSSSGWSQFKITGRVVPTPSAALAGSLMLMGLVYRRPERSAEATGHPL